MVALLRLFVILLSNIALPSLAIASEFAALSPLADVQIDAKSLGEIVAATAGDVRPDKVAKYGGDFVTYWKAASAGLSGKVFEAVITDTCNSRFRGVGDGRRIIPTAILGDPGNAADLRVIEANGKVTGLIQAKLGVNDILEALDDPKYASMDLVTSQETFDELQTRLRRETARAINRGRPLKPVFQRLSDAIESGRLWSKMPCGAPLPERSVIERIGQSHFQSRWTKLANPAADDIARGAVAAEQATAHASRHVTQQVPRSGSSADEMAAAGDDLVRAAVGSTDDALSTSAKLARGTLRWAGPIAAGVEAVAAGYEAKATEQQYAAGLLSHEQREVAHASTVGGVGGSWAAGTGGAAGGAAVGTMICPGVGTAVGAIVGGVGGAVGGSAAGRVVAAKSTEALHRTGNTFASTAEWTARCARNAYRWATDW